MILYTIGDSFTYGQELEDPSTQAWPALLANELGYKLINEGRPGIGNEFIIKKTIQAVAKHKPKLVVIAWTSCGRQEYADEHGAYDIWPGASGKTFSGDPSGKLLHRHELIKYITLYDNPEHEYRRWLRQVILLQSFLQIHKIDYIMCNVFDNQFRFQEFSKNNQEYYELIDKDRFIGWPTEGIVEWTWGTEQGPDGHPLQEGHKRIAKRLYEACNITR
jgi:hypothetical protein